MRIRLVCISGLLGRGLRQKDVDFVDLLASRACMEASWIPLSIGLHVGSVMGAQ